MYVHVHLTDPGAENLLYLAGVAVIMIGDLDPESNAHLDGKNSLIEPIYLSS